MSKFDSDEFGKLASERLAARIKALRVRQGYTSYENFAIRHNISRMQYWRYEKGEDLRFSSLVRLSRAFNMTLEEFFSEGFEDLAPE